MNKIQAILLCTGLMMCIGLDGQTLFEENFDAVGLPDGWSVETNATDAGWSVGTPNDLSSGYFPIPDNGSGRIVATNDDACNCDKRDEYLISPAIDLSSVTAAVLNFDAFYTDQSYQGNQEDATIEVSTDGVNWTVISDLEGEGSWTNHSISLNDYAGESEVYLGFRYDDNSGWLYGFGLDNVVISVPPRVDFSLTSIIESKFGEVDRSMSLGGVVFNSGSDEITSMVVEYSVDGEVVDTEKFEGLSVPSLGTQVFEMSMAWAPSAVGLYNVELTITAVNDTIDERLDDNSRNFDIEVFKKVVVPNKIDELLATAPIVRELTGAAPHLDGPTDLDFFPILGKDELWVINQRTESEGGSTLTISDATADVPSNYWHRVDGNSWHFMSLPTGIAFSDDNFNFGSSAGVKDANHGNGTFTGPTLWSSDPTVYALPSGGNGSHLDMLHGSPFCMGIAHEKDNAFWVWDNWNKDIVRYDFVEDHGPGNDDHSDGMVHRYRGTDIFTDGDIPNHLVMDKASGWLYVVDNGNNKVVRLDINSGSGTADLPLINEPLEEHAEILDFTLETVVDSDLDKPSGIELFENYLLVGNYANGDINVYDMDDDFAFLGTIPTMEEGLTGIKVGPDGNIWCVNRELDALFVVEPDESSSVLGGLEQIAVSVSPNPTSGQLRVQIPTNAFASDLRIEINNTVGQLVASWENVDQIHEADISSLASGTYILHLRGQGVYYTQSIVIAK